MRRTTIRIRNDPRPAIRRTVREIARDDNGRRTRNVLGAAKVNLRSRSRRSSGEIARTLDYSIQETAFGFASSVGSDDPRALWVEEGTGIYGPHRAPVVARSGGWMAFKNARGFTVFARQTRGSPGKHFLRDAASAAHD